MTLEDRARDVLARLSVLAEGATTKLDADPISHGKSESRAPSGTDPTRDTEKPPDKARCSLFEWHSWHFARVGDDPPRLESLILLAEMDYREYRFRVAHRVRLRSGELVENDRTDGGAAERAQIDRVVDWYESVPALTVAVLEGQTEAWVRKARRMHARDPKDGRPRPEFYEWDEERRHQEVAALAANDLGKKAIGQRLGVDPGTVRRYMPAGDLVAA